MAITAHQADKIRCLWNHGFDTFAIAAEFKMKEAEVYNYVTGWIERKANKCRVRKLLFGDTASKTASLSAYRASASQQA